MAGFINLGLIPTTFYHFIFFFRLGLGTSRSKLNYKQFLHAFEEGRKSSYGPRKQDVRIEEQPDLNPQEAEHRLRELVGSQVEVLERVGLHTGLIEPRREKTGFSHMRKQRRRSASR